MSLLKERLDDSVHKPNNNSDSQSKTLFKFKVIMLGDVAVGKTSLLRRYIEDQFSKEYKCTIGVEFRLTTIDINDSTGAELKIWDTCGEEKYRVITRQYYRDAPGVVLVFDLTNKESFYRLSGWLSDIELYAPENVTILVIGNKSDKVNERAVSIEAIRDFCKDNGNLNYIETSALSGVKVNILFRSMAISLVDKEKENKGTSKFVNNYNSPLASTMLSKKMKELNNEATCCG